MKILFKKYADMEYKRKSINGQYEREYYLELLQILFRFY